MNEMNAASIHLKFTPIHTYIVETLSTEVINVIVLLNNCECIIKVIAHTQELVLNAHHSKLKLKSKYFNTIVKNRK